VGGGAPEAAGQAEYLETAIFHVPLLSLGVVLRTLFTAHLAVLIGAVG
jgi:hypothetical protein